MNLYKNKVCLSILRHYQVTSITEQKSKTPDSKMFQGFYLENKMKVILNMNI